jgi:putative membrane protein insertion efficiency factor
VTAARIVTASLFGAWRLLVSPLLGPACRFEPSCSRYMQQAIDTHGPLRGLSLGVVRLCRCHPWGGFGFDPVPPRRQRPACSAGQKV